MIRKMDSNNLIQQSQFKETEQTKPEESKVVEGPPVNRQTQLDQYITDHFHPSADQKPIIGGPLGGPLGGGLWGTESEPQYSAAGDHRPGVFERHYRKTESHPGEFLPRDLGSAVTPDMLRVEEEKFTPTKLAAAAEQRFAPSTQESLLRGALESQLMEKEHQIVVSETSNEPAKKKGATR